MNINEAIAILDDLCRSEGMFHIAWKTCRDRLIEETQKAVQKTIGGKMDSNNQSPERILNAPSKHSLSECFEELKFGRPAKDQKFLSLCIKMLSKLNSFSDEIAEASYIHIQKNKYKWTLESLKRHLKKILDKSAV